MTKSAAIRSILAEGPATANEITLEIGARRQAVSSILHSLVRRGYAQAVSKVHGRMYELTPRGNAAYRRDKRR